MRRSTRQPGTVTRPWSAFQVTFARSAPIVVSSPCPVCTTVSSGSASSWSRIEATSSVPVAERAAGRAGPAVEQGVAGEHAAELRGVEADAAGRVARGVQHPQRGAGDLDLLAVGEVDVPQLVGVGELPQRPVVGVQQDRRGHPLPQRRRDPDVVVVGVGAQDRLDRAVADDREDRLDVVRGVDHHALGVVADHPDVVVDVEGLAVEGERARRTAWSTRAVTRAPRRCAGRRRRASWRTRPRRRRGRSPR